MKKTTKKKKKQAKDIKLEFAKEDLEHTERVYDRYLRVLVKYNIKDVAYSAIASDDLFSSALKRKLENLKDNKKGISDLILGKPYKNELDAIEGRIKYYKELIGHVRNTIEKFPDDIKIKIADDSITKRHAWLNIVE